VTNGKFTNIYVFPNPVGQGNPGGVTWDEHMAHGGPGRTPLRPDYQRFTRAAIDHFTDTLMTQPWPTYFDALYQFNGINPPQFFGSGFVLKSCIDAALHDLHNGIMQWDTIRSLSNCHIDGQDPSPQVNLIFSPDIKIAPITPLSTGGDICQSIDRAWHAWGINTPNFSALPTDPACGGDFDTFTQRMSHEIVEMLSDPGGVGIGDIGQNEVADTCQRPGVEVVNWQGMSLARYHSNFDNDCLPKLDPPAGSQSATWVLGQGAPLQHLSADVPISRRFAVPAQRVAIHGPLTQALLVVQVGDTALHGGSGPSDNADATLFLSGTAAPVTLPNINRGRTWDSGTTHAVAFSLPMGQMINVDTLASVSIGIRRGGSAWDIAKVALIASFPNGAQGPWPTLVSHDWVDASGLPLFVLGGGHQRLELPVPYQDGGRPVVGLELVLSTGGDDLRSDDGCVVTIFRTSGPTIPVPCVDRGQSLSNWTIHTIGVPVPPGLQGGQIERMTIMAGSNGDNWNLERVQLRAKLNPP
jgi:hypothetical protein